MNGEALLQNGAVILAGLILTLLFVLHWVFRTDQSKVPRNRRVATMIARRLTLVFAGLFLLCAITGWAAWILLAVAAISKSAESEMVCLSFGHSSIERLLEAR